MDTILRQAQYENYKNKNKKRDSKGYFDKLTSSLKLRRTWQYDVIKLSMM